MFTRNHSMITTVIALVLAGMTSAAQETAPPADQPSDNWRKFDERVSADAAPVAGQLTLPAGTWLTVRIEQELSSDRSLKGDAFTASLVQPLIANGVVVAMRGQMVGGQVVEAEKAGRAKGTSRLGVALTELSLVDGQQVPLKTRFTEYKGGTSVGRDVGAVAATTGVGAAIGAAADGGFGAGMGAIAGAAVGMDGILTTRGKPTVF
jgi:hypothetical protein